MNNKFTEKVTDKTLNVVYGKQPQERTDKTKNFTW